MAPGSLLTQDSTYRVLVCATELAVINEVTGALEREGWEYELLASPEQARRRALRPDIDVVVCDLAFGAPAIDLIPALRARRPAPPVILLAGMEQRQTAALAMRTGAFSYAIKPIFPDEIAAHVARALDWHREAGRSDSRMARRDATPSPALSRSGDEKGRLGALSLLSALELRSVETSEHLERIGRGAEAVARALGWVENEQEAEIFRLAAALHDIGKIAIPDSVLDKPGRLTPEEMEIVRSHTRLGAELFRKKGDSPLLQAAAEIALHHHERWDGGGYPSRLAGEAIPAWARVVTVVDVYDALVHDRVYRAAVPEHVALSYMRFQRARHFDPRVYDAFLETLPILRKIRWQAEESRAA